MNIKVNSEWILKELTLGIHRMDEDIVHFVVHVLNAPWVRLALSSTNIEINEMENEEIHVFEVIIEDLIKPYPNLYNDILNMDDHDFEEFDEELMSDDFILKTNNETINNLFNNLYKDALVYRSDNEDETDTYYYRPKDKKTATIQVIDNIENVEILIHEGDINDENLEHQHYILENGNCDNIHTCDNRPYNINKLTDKLIDLHSKYFQINKQLKL
jgi:hypothetical protein